MHLLFRDEEIYKKTRHGVTLIELVVVIIVLSILLAIALPNLTGVRESTYNKEAVANLILIWHAQDIYYIDKGVYFPNSTAVVSDITAMNRNLTININNKTWNYSISCSPSDCSGYRASAARGAGVAPSGHERTFNMTSTQGRQIQCSGSSGACPWSSYSF